MTLLASADQTAKAVGYMVLFARKLFSKMQIMTRIVSEGVILECSGGLPR
jgi:hypothetical protein